MTIFYKLYESKLTDGPDDRVAIVQKVKQLALANIIDRIVWRGSTINRADILAVLEDYFDAIEELLLEGNSLVTPVTNYSVRIRGLFDGDEDGFDSERHRLRVSTAVGNRLRTRFQSRADVEKQSTVIPEPKLITFKDLNSDTRNSTLTPGGLGKLTGNLLKFDTTDPNQGIFLVTDDGPSIRIAVVAENLPSKLVFLIPADVALGIYRLEVRTLLNGSSELRSGSLRKLLTVHPTDMILPSPPG